MMVDYANEFHYKMAYIFRKAPSRFNTYWSVFAMDVRFAILAMCALVVGLAVLQGYIISSKEDKIDVIGMVLGNLF